MPPSCSICASKIKHKIDQFIVTGASNRAISRQFPDFSKDAVRRHRPHVSKKIQEANDEQEKQDCLQLDSLLKETVDDLRDLADNAKHAADYKAAASALGHIIRVAEILTKTNPDKPDRPYETMTDEQLNAELTELLQSAKNQAS